MLRVRGPVDVLSEVELRAAIVLELVEIPYDRPEEDGHCFDGTL